jgi:hypothetical protein
MTKYNIEGNINFYDELFKSLDDSDDEDDAKLCQITGLPLDDKAVTLECNHHFNYDALYRELCKQKFDFKTYEIHHLSKNEQIKFLATKLDYYIKCPYCRNMSFSILPYYEELGLKKKYGINSLDNTLPDKISLTPNIYPSYESDDYTYVHWGVTFKKGQCCETMIYEPVKCSQKFVANIPGTDLSYCNCHYKGGLKKYKIGLKQHILDEKRKLFDEKNKERHEKGLPPLKRFPSLKSKSKIENVVKEPNVIGQYVPEAPIVDTATVDANVDKNTEPIFDITDIFCKVILKTGPNKGKECGFTSANKNGVCKRHSAKNI